MKTFRFRGKTYRWNVQKMHNAAFWAMIVIGMTVICAGLWSGAAVATGLLG